MDKYDFRINEEVKGIVDSVLPDGNGGIYGRLFKIKNDSKIVDKLVDALSVIPSEDILKIPNRGGGKNTRIGTWISELNTGYLQFEDIVQELAESFYGTVNSTEIRSVRDRPVSYVHASMILETFRYKGWLLWPDIDNPNVIKRCISIPSINERYKDKKRPLFVEFENEYYDWIESLSLNMDDTGGSGMGYGLMGLLLKADLKDISDVSVDFLNIVAGKIGVYAARMIVAINKERKSNSSLFKYWRPQAMLWDVKEKAIKTAVAQLHVDYDEGDFLTTDYAKLPSHSKDRDSIACSKYDDKFTVLNSPTNKELGGLIGEFVSATALAFIEMQKSKETVSLFRKGNGMYDMLADFDFHNIKSDFEKLYPGYLEHGLGSFADEYGLEFVADKYFSALENISHEKIVENIVRCRFASPIIITWMNRARAGDNVNSILEDVAAYTLLTFNTKYSVATKRIKAISFYQSIKLSEVLRYRDVWLFPRYQWKKELKKYLYLPIPERSKQIELSNNFIAIRDGLPRILDMLVNDDKLLITTAKNQTQARYFFLLNAYLSAEVKDYSDLSTELFEYLSYRVDQALKSVEGYITALSKKHYKLFKDDRPVPVYITESSKKAGKKKELGVEKDIEFTWVMKEEPKLKRWVDLASWFIKQDTHGLKSDYAATKHFADIFMWLLEVKKNDPEGFLSCLNPEDILRFKHIRVNMIKEADPVNPTLRSYVSDLNKGRSNNILGMAEKFFREVNAGINVPVNMASDRFVIAPARGDLSTSNKPVIPTKIWNLMKLIIVEDDYKWHKSIDTDRTSGKVGDGEWVPSRAIFMQTLLTVPIRFDNAQTADSGYMDKLWYDEETNTFINNPNYKMDKINAKGRKSRQLGAVKYFHDHRGSSLGFYFTNNKTSTNGNGLNVVWDNIELRKALMIQRNYLKKHDAFVPYNIAEVRGWSPRTMERMGHACIIYPLFLDLGHPLNKHKHEPVRSGRIKDYFLRLLGEAEVRYNNSEEGRENPLVIPLISDWRIKEYRKGRNKLEVPVTIPMESEFTVHSCRVTGITHFACSGLPPHIIAQCLAGHSSILMNLYYTKLGPTVISNIITKAHDEKEQNENLLPLSILSKEIPILEKIFTHGGHEENITLLSKTDSSLWWVAKGFICPNRGTKCDSGGHDKYAVNLGKADCSRCKYAITGPMLLNQLVSASNQLVYQLDVMFEKFNNLTELAQQSSDNKFYAEQQKYISQANATEEDMKSTVESMLGYIDAIKRAKALIPTWKALNRRLESNDDINKIIDEFKDKNDSANNLKTDEEPELQIIDGVSRDVLTILMAFIGDYSPSNKEPLADERLFKMVLRFMDKYGATSMLLSLSDDEAKKASLMFAQTMAAYFYGTVEKQNIEFNDVDTKALEFTNAMIGGSADINDVPELDRIVRRMVKVLDEKGLDEMSRLNSSESALEAARNNLALIQIDGKEVVNG